MSSLPLPASLATELNHYLFCFSPQPLRTTFSASLQTILPLPLARDHNLRTRRPRHDGRFPSPRSPLPTASSYSARSLAGAAYLRSHGAEVSTGKEKSLRLVCCNDGERGDRMFTDCSRNTNTTITHSPQKMAPRPRDRSGPAYGYLTRCSVSSPPLYRPAPGGGAHQGA